MQVATLSIQGLNYLSSGETPELLGNAHPNIVPYQVFPTTDGNIIVAVGNDAQFERFAAFIGVPELAENKEFATNEHRVRNRDKLTLILNDIMSQKPSQYWLDGLESIKVSCGPINQIDKVFENEQVLARGMKIQMDHPLSPEPVDLIGNPINMSVTPPTYRRPPPTMGEHTSDVLRDLLGLSNNDLAGLKERGVI